MIPTEYMVVDETVYEFEPKDHTKLKRKQANQVNRSTNLHDALAPKRFIPRKPHPNGLVVYHAAFDTQHGPYLYDLEPDLLVNSPLNPRDALMNIATRWSNDISLHLTTDAGFTDYDLFSNFLTKGIYLTSSFNSGHKLWLYDFLYKICPPQSAVAVSDKNGIVWSLLRSTEEKKEAVHFVVISAFISVLKPPTAQLLDCKSKDVLTLGRLSHPILKAMASSLKIDTNLPLSDLIGSVYSKLAHVADSSPMKIAPAIQPVSPEDKVPPNPPQPQNNLNVDPNANSEDEKKRARLKELMALRVDQLKEYLKSLSLSTQGRKAGLVERIIAREFIAQDEIAAFQDALIASPTPHADAHAHHHYKRTFNSVDRHDSKWYDMQSHHHVREWASKLIISILESSLVNSFVVFSFHHPITFSDFCSQLARAICSTKFNF